MSAHPDIQLLPNAARRVSEIAQKLGKSALLRLSVEGGGCSGFQYRFCLADSNEADDVGSASGSAKLVGASVSPDPGPGIGVPF